MKRDLCKQKRKYILRGEHLVNVHEYLKGVRLKWDESRGYSLEFAQKHDEIIQEIIDNPNSTVKIISGFDDICNCGVCPNKKDSCLSEEVVKRDFSVASGYGITIGNEYKSKELVDLLLQRTMQNRNE